MKPSVDGLCFPVQARGMNTLMDKKGERIHTCQDVPPALFFVPMADVHFCRRGHLKQPVVPGSVYVSVYGSAVQLEEVRRKNESLEGKTEEYSRSLWGDALKMVVGETGERKTEKELFI